ncbi:MAG TPA: peptide chain release factor 1 [Candidatus Dormibacteraeota bacterium]|nr:peptide chain release factor 1 [Candidatus Dormibacteraeota bacterium]
MFEQLDAVRERYDTITQRLADPAVHSDLRELQRLGKEQAQLRDLVQLYEAYRRAERSMAEARELAEHERDPEMQAYARQEFDKQQAEHDRLGQELTLALVPKDPTDEKDVIIEIRQGTGGDEAALFAADLFRMYSRYAESRHWKVDIVSESVTERGGFKEVIFEVRGRGAYSRLKFENGVHRVQRVPETEAQGRIHTSTATVVVLPEAEDVEVAIDPDRLKVEVFRSTGHGGQSVNTTDSAVRLTYMPEGGGEPIVASSQDERSQLKNRAKAMKVLLARILDRQLAERQAALTQARRSAVGTGDRSEKIRTYNYPEGRITDHRIELKYYKLPQFVQEGDLDPVIDRLIAWDQGNRLSEPAPNGAPR